MSFKIGDKIKLLTDYYEDGDISQNVSKGSILEVLEKCRTAGQWIDQTSVEFDFLKPPHNHANEFELVEEEKVKNKFEVGDRVILANPQASSGHDLEEGWIGYIIDPNDGSDDIPVQVGEEKNINIYYYFDEDELELLSVGKGDFSNIKVRHDSIGLSFDNPKMKVTPADIEGISKEAEYTGGSSSYYKVDVVNPTTSEAPYQAECSDIIEALGLTFTEGNIFKAIWRIAADRQGKKKKGNNSVYDAEKVVFFAERLLIQEKSKEGK